MALSDSGGVICRNFRGKTDNQNMNNQRFDILGCALQGIRSVFAEWRYLSSIALVPVGLTALITLFKAYGIENKTLTTNVLATLPTSALAAWFMFLQTRLLVFGERGGQNSAVSGDERRRAFEASMILWLLTSLASLGFTTFVAYWGEQMQQGGSTGLTAVGYLMLGAAFWALRFSLVHILGAIGYSIRSYIYRVNGVMVSLRIFAMMMIVFFPVSFVSGPVAQALLDAAQREAPMMQIFGLQLILCALTFIFLAFFNAAGVFALREMLKLDVAAAQGDKR